MISGGWDFVLMLWIEYDFFVVVFGICENCDGFVKLWEVNGFIFCLLVGVLSDGIVLLKLLIWKKFGMRLIIVFFVLWFIF